MTPFRYLGYEASCDVPNIVVDGSPNRATVLSISHWPGIVQPTGLGRDLSAQMAFAYLDDVPDHPPADVVTNNHFDQDGIVSLFALVEPDIARRHRELLIDVAAAGDFATYRDRRAARASMVLSRAVEMAPEECSYDEITDQLYADLLPQLMSIVLDVDRYRDQWADEDADLAASERAIADGRVAIEERPGLDLAVVRVSPDEPVRRGHRFGGESSEGVHPMALHNATDRFRVLVVHGRRYRFVDRYETWVQYRSRPTLPRVDMRPLADMLTAKESDREVVWHAGSPDDLTPELAHSSESTLDADDVIAAVSRHLV